MKDAVSAAEALGAFLIPHEEDFDTVGGSDYHAMLAKPLYSVSHTLLNTEGKKLGLVVGDARRMQKRLARFGQLSELAAGTVAIGVSAVGVRGKEGERIGVGFENLSSPFVWDVADTLKSEFGDDIELYETGRISQHTSGQAACDPVVPGCAVSAVRGSFGTLGAIVMGKHLGSAFISNAHVLRQSQGGLVYQPSLDKPDRRIIGETYQVVAPAAHEVNTFDGAVARLRSRVAYELELDGAGRGFGEPVDELTTGSRVVKYGAGSGLTYGELDQFGTRVQAWYGQTKMVFARQYEIVGRDSRPFSVPGDSGSVVATEGELRPFGLLFGGSRERSWASPLEAALVSFGVSLAGD